MPETGESKVDAVGFVLAGGQSSRMGTDKALVEFGGQPLIVRALNILTAARLKAFIAGALPHVRSRMELYAPIIPDREPGLGPLGGICSALESTPAKFAVFLPVDIPLLPSSLVSWLIHRARISDAAVTLPAVNGSPQTFPAVISRRALPALERELADRRLGCLASFRSAAVELGESVSIVDVEALVQSGQAHHPQSLPAVRWFLNLNALRDLRRAASLAGTRVS
jgi:molybdopterin-guanine dinucleotide biosynthesis protein A